MLRIAEGYKPHAKQLRLHQSGARFVIAAAGVRGGKSKSASVEFVRRVFRDYATPSRHSRVAGVGKRRRPRLHYWVVAPTSHLLREPMRYVFEAVPGPLIEQYYESDKALWLKGDILIEFKSAADPKTLVASGLHGLWIDEAARVSADAWMGQLRQRLSDRAGWGLFSTTPLGRNWVFTEIVKRSPAFGGSDPEFDTVAWHTADNPIIPASEIESARRQLPKRYFDREYLASFDSFLGNVFDEWSDATHVLSLAQLQALVPNGDVVRAAKRVVAGVDWGWNSPASIVVVADLGWALVVLDELYERNLIVHDPSESKTLVNEAKRLKQRWGISQFLADPESPANIFDFQRAGLPVRSADNQIALGIRKMTERMHVVANRPRMFVLDHCVNLIREVREYVWAEGKGGIYVDAPAPNQSDHAIDACRYATVELTRYESMKSDAPVAVPVAAPAAPVVHSALYRNPNQR